MVVAVERVAHRASRVVHRQAIVPAKMWLWLFFLVPTMWSHPSWGQTGSGFLISGQADGVKKGEMQLTIFSTPQQTSTAHIRKGHFEFQGSVAGPTVAMLQQKRGGDPLYFFLENASVSVLFRPSAPASSPISGSRTNSQYRYVLELCHDGNPQPEDCIVAYAHEHRGECFIPFLYYTHLSGERLLEEAAFVDSLLAALHDVYPYALLQQRVANVARTAVGQPMPDFLFRDLSGREQHFDSVRVADRSHLLVFIPSWHEAFPSYVDSLRSQYPSLPLTPVLVDKQPKGWDEPFVSLLDIDHVPFLILVDAEGTIAARNLRRWEVGRQLESLSRSGRAGRPQPSADKASTTE